MNYKIDSEGIVTLLPPWKASEANRQDAIVFVRLCASFSPGLFHLECTKKQAILLEIDTSQVLVLDQNRNVCDDATEEAILLIVMKPGSEVKVSTSLAAAKRNWFMALCFGQAQETELEERYWRYDGANVKMSGPAWLSQEGQDAEVTSGLIFEQLNKLAGAASNADIALGGVLPSSDQLACTAKGVYDFGCG